MLIQKVTLESPTGTDEFDDLLGAESSPLDKPLSITIFRNGSARECERRNVSLRTLAVDIHAPTTATKSALPWLKLARFGDVRTEKGSLRHNANVQAVDGIEADYDGERVSIGEAAALIEKAGLAALIYSSPSHTPDAPRWRVLCPLSSSAAPAERDRLCARLNGALGGILASESFTLSQAYYFGRVNGAAKPETALIPGRALDDAPELDSIAIDRNGIAPLPEITADPDDDDDFADDLVDWVRIKSALSAIPVSAADSADPQAGRPTGRDLWLQVGQAIHSACAGNEKGLEVWTEWSRGGEKFGGERDQQQKWRSFSGHAITVGSLYHIAGLYGWGKPEPSRLQFYSPAECEAAPRRGYIIKGLIAPRDVACIYGAPGAGKSLLAPFLGYMTARGELAFGMRTRAGGVLYVAAEDTTGMMQRVTALRLRFGDAPRFAVVGGVSDLLNVDSPDLEALREAVDQQRPSLIILDTLAMSFPGLEENTAEDMGRVIKIARLLTEHGAAVVLIHHDTKAQTPTPRGHSLLNGALDVALQLFPKDESGIVRGRLSKNRNGACDRDIAFTIATETLGTDEDGDPITAAVVHELAAGSGHRRPPPRLAASERAALEVLTALQAGNATVSSTAWQDACIDSRAVCVSEERANRRKAASRAVAGLIRKGVIVINEAGLVGEPSRFEPDAFDLEGEE